MVRPKAHRASWTLIATHGGDELVRAEPFGAIEVELSALWSPAAPSSEREPL